MPEHAILDFRISHDLGHTWGPDEGHTWPGRRHIDTGDGFAGEANHALNRSLAYPSIAQTADGRLHVAYSYAGRQCIRYVRFAENWVRGGRAPLFD